MALYAAVFVLVNVTYLALCWEAVDRPAHEDVSQRMRRLLRMRSFVTIGVFLAAALIALKRPVVAMTPICLCLITSRTFRAGTRPESHVTTCRDEQPRRTVCGWAC